MVLLVEQISLFGGEGYCNTAQEAKSLIGSCLDLEQFLFAWEKIFCRVYAGGMGRPLRFLFAGNNIAEEIMGFQKIFGKALHSFNNRKRNDCGFFIPKKFFPKMVFYGVDSNKEVIESAQTKKYLFETRFFEQSILGFNQEIQFNIDETGEAQTPRFLTFDVIVCKNILINQNKTERAILMQKIVELSNDYSLIVFAKTDPTGLKLNLDKENHIYFLDNDFFYCEAFGNKLFSLKHSQKKQRIDVIEDSFWGSADFLKMSLFNRFPKNKPVELKVISRMVKKIESPRVLIIGGGLGHQVYEIAIMIAEECKKQEKDLLNAKIVAVEQLGTYAVQILNGHVCANDLEELNAVQKQYFFKKPHPSKGVYYWALNREMVPPIEVQFKDVEDYAKMAIDKFDLIFCYKAISAETEKYFELFEKIDSLLTDRTITFFDSAIFVPRTKNNEEFNLLEDLNLWPWLASGLPLTDVNCYSC